MEKTELSPKLISAIEEIVAKGDTAEVKRRKNDVIVLSVRRKTKGSAPAIGGEQEQSGAKD